MLWKQGSLRFVARGLNERKIYVAQCPDLHSPGRPSIGNRPAISDRSSLEAAGSRGAANMVLELGQEGCQFNYVVSAHKPTSVQHSAVGHFTSATDLNLIIS